MKTTTAYSKVKWIIAAQLFCFTFLPFAFLHAQCTDFQFSFGGVQNERAYDVASTLNNEFFVAGITKSFGNGDEILITKHKADGTLLWAKVYGFSGNESIRKIAPATDGGLMIIGQTNSLDNRSGDILSFKINGNGIVVWTRKFGIGSFNGDLGMDIIETSDGGYALTGILNVNGGVADMAVIKLNSNADVVWSKRFDRGDGEDGVGIIQEGNNLVVASDLQNSNSNYEIQVMKLNLADGNFITSKKLTPSSRGLFNPYLYKNPAGAGYFISGHSIDNTSYANMKHTILELDNDFNIVRTKTISINPVSNDFFTGLQPLADGSFIGCSSPQQNATGNIYRVASDNSLVYAKSIKKSGNLRTYRLAVSGQKAIVVGSIEQNGQEDIFINGFDITGPDAASCNVENANVVMEQPSFTAQPFTWPTIENISFSNAHQTILSKDVTLSQTDLCPQPCKEITINGPKNICTQGKNVIYTIQRSPGCTALYNLTYDNSMIEVVAQTDSSFAAVFKKEGIVQIKASVISGCKIIENKFDVGVKFSPDTINMGPDLVTCSDTSFTLQAGAGFDQYQWQDGSSIATFVVNSAGTYFVRAQNSCGLVLKDTLVYEKRKIRPFAVSPMQASVCKGDSIQLKATGGDQYSWYPQPNFNNSTDSSVRAIVNADENFRVSIKDDVCLRDTVINIAIVAAELPVISVSKSNDVNCTIDSAVLVATGAETYSWSPNLFISQNLNGKITVKPSETLTYYVQGKNLNGCVSKDSVHVAFLKSGSQKLYIPSAFTPNNDGLNDIFKPILVGPADKYDFQIFDRWGVLLFKSKTPGQGWNGTYKGGIEPGGVYVYYITAKGTCGDLFEQKGTFILIR